MVESVEMYEWAMYIAKSKFSCKCELRTLFETKSSMSERMLTCVISQWMFDTGREAKEK